MTRREMLAAIARCAGAGLGMTCLGGGVSAFAADRKREPNLVFIMADDLGWRDTSVYGSTFYETPNVDALAGRGMLFTNAYSANPLCSPTRASIMTGLYPARVGITSPVCHLPQEILEQTIAKKAPPQQRALLANSITRLKLDYYTLAEALKAAGYATGHFGKWHLGREPYDPLHQGFDVDIPHTSGPGPDSYIAPWKLNLAAKPGDQLDDRMSEEVVKFIRQNKDRPFFLNYWCFSVHSPYGAKPDLIEKYTKRAAPKNPQRNPVMGAMIESMDDGVGRVVKAIDDLGLAENTIVVFFSDNGGVMHQKIDGVPMTSNAPLRGMKATTYEGGVRVPCIVIWPGVTKAGSRSEEIMSSIDWYPTILEMLELKPQHGQKFDGISIVPALRGRYLSRDTIFCHFPHDSPATGGLASTFVRKGDWKLIRFYCGNPGQTDRYELYNLKDDIGEEHNLAEKMPEKVKELDALIDGFLKDTNAAIPQPNPAYQPNRP